MTVKKKAVPAKKPSVNPREIEKAHAASARETKIKEAQNENKKRHAAALEKNKKLAPKVVEQIMKNDLVKVKLVSKNSIPIDPDPISATPIDGLMEYRIAGTHLRLLGMADPAQMPTIEQRVHMARRLNEVGPYLPRYVQSVEFSTKMPKEKAEPVKKIDPKDFGIDENHAPKAPAENPRNTGGHNWVKQNLVSNSDGSDDYSCENEGCTKKFKRKGLGWSPPAGKCVAAKEPIVTRMAVVQKTVKGPALEGGVPLKKICAEVDIDPKDARRALRAAKIDKPGGRWEWPQTEVEKIKKILQKARDDLIREQVKGGVHG